MTDLTDQNDLELVPPRSTPTNPPCTSNPTPSSTLLCNSHSEPSDPIPAFYPMPGSYLGHSIIPRSKNPNPSPIAPHSLSRKSPSSPSSGLDSNGPSPSSIGHTPFYPRSSTINPSDPWLEQNDFCSSSPASKTRSLSLPSHPSSLYTCKPF
ncbi:hypothetical protein NE237_024728 [Protea cynaroides]|uniref:Uncharacterized protein n=1 Tax=Protea cynaroides TaxID=273540 RepID=A0A9Q0JZW4_9MAGN|nr:hypothetical protein NE237_024728 [Protea cynaroides]